MATAAPTIVITGISGNLGLRLLPQLAEFQVVGVDLHAPKNGFPSENKVRFIAMDLAEEESCRELFLLFKQYRPAAVIHLAFVLDPLRIGILDVERMWQINVAGTARVMEAIAETNRLDPVIQKFVALSSVAAYGPNLAQPATESTPLSAHTLPYAMHKMEADKVVQQRAPGLSGCSVYVLRPHIFAGATMDNYMVGAFRGTPNGKSPRATKMRTEGKRLPCMLPYGQRYLDNKIQFVHVDDVARLIAHIASKAGPASQRLTIMNVAGRGEPLTFARCVEMAGAKLIRVPGQWGERLVLQLLWKFGISAIPPEATPYMTSEYIMDTDRLKEFLGADYETVIQYKIADAFADCFATPS